MNILIIGQGGREHALAWKVAQSSEVQQVWVAPGNAGTSLEKKVKNIAIDPLAVDQLIQFAKDHHVDLTIVGPEAPLSIGIVDAFTDASLKCFGPSKAAAQLEASKSFSKDFMRENNIPTANYATFNDIGKALTYLHQQSLPIVIKADGLAAGKGVVIAETWAEAETTIRDMLSGNRFGEAGHSIVLEEFLIGEELSYIVMSDGIHVLPLASSQDHKRRDDNDLGPNTGGMGAFSPAPHLTAALENKILEQVIYPTVFGMKKRGTPYIGFLYAGIMICKNEPKVLEFNCRLGDPETQPILMRLNTDLVDLCLKGLSKNLDQITIDWDPRFALSVVLAAKGYPNSYPKGEPIQGLNSPLSTDLKIFHAGTQESQGKILTNGGRVLAATALGETLAIAQKKAYTLTKSVQWDNCYYRNDIGSKLIA